MYPTQRQPATSRVFAKKPEWLAIGLILLSSLALYFPVRNFSYLAIDDGMHTEMNPRIYPFTQENLLSFWKEPYENAYTPLTYTTWMLLSVAAKNTAEEQKASADFMVPQGLKLDPGVYHVGNAVIHAICSVLVFYFLMLLIPNPFAAGAGALLFTVHPLQVETVCWITGLRDVLAGALSVASILFYFKYTKTKYRQGTNLFDAPILSSKNAYYLLGLFFFFLAALCKSSSLVVPGIIAILGFCFLQRSPKLLFLELLPWFLPIIPLLVVFMGLNSSVADKVVFKAPLEGRIIIALDAIAFYLSKLFVPYPLVMDYGRTPQYVLKEAPYWLTALATVSIGIVLSCLAIKRKALWLFACFLIFILGLAPILGITPFIFQHISTVADRYVYVSMIAPALALAWIVHHTKWQWMPNALGILLFALTIRSFTQVPVWKNNLSLFSYTLRFNPKSWLAANDLGTVYENLKQWDKAAQLYRSAAQISNIPSAWNNYGAAALKNQDYNGAIQGFTEALISSGYTHWAYNNLAVAYSYAGQKQEAKTYFKKSLEAHPGFIFATKNLKVVEKNEPLSQLKIQRSSQDEG